MHALLVSAYFRPHVGGVERFVENLAQGLVGRGHEVSILCCRTDASSTVWEEVGGCRIERVPASNFLERRFGVPYPVPEPNTLLRVLSRRLDATDIVHVQDAIYATSVPALLLAHRRHVATVLTQHVGFVPQRSRTLDAIQRLAHATLGRSARLATIVATYNASVADWTREQWAINDPRVLPVGVLAAPPAADRLTLRRAFGLSVDRFVALFVGRDVPKKGLDLFLAAADPAYDLVAVTDRVAVVDSATLMPFMSRDRLQGLLSCVDAFVLPSGEGEGFPLSLQEALHVGLPVVTTYQSGYERFVSDNDVMFVERDATSVRNALLRLLADRSLRKQLSERSRAVAKKHFQITSFVSAYESLYEEARCRVRNRRS
jgi:glycosyltransferase involved in cell wall biosynthesis